MRKMLLAGIILAFASTGLYAVVYEASTLHNAVARSETVQDLFFERWSYILDRQQYLDLYGKINWIPGFKVNTYNRGTGKKEAVDMTLVRGYGSLTVNIPVLGGYDKGEITRRLSKAEPAASDKGAEEEATEEKGVGPMGLVKPKSLVVGFTATGFHYGLRRESTVDRGSAGSESISDSRYTQFFDDIFALSVLYIPYFYVHGGIIMNNQIEPNDDGTMDYFDNNEGYPEYRYFLASNLFSFLNLNATTTKEGMEKLAVDVGVTKLTGMLVKVHPLTPQVTVGYRQLNLFNDEPWDSVWVRSDVAKDGTPKTLAMDDADKEQAKLHTFSFLVTEDLFNTVFLDFFVEGQYCTETLIEKRTGEELDLQPLRELRGSIGLNFIEMFSDNRPDSLRLDFGLGYYWDPALAIHREGGYAYGAKGFYTGLRYDHPFAGAEVTVSYNYSKELRKLAEAVDKVALEGSLFVRF